MNLFVMFLTMCNGYNRNIYFGTYIASSIAVVLKSNRCDKREESCDAVPRFHTQRVGARRDSSPQRLYHQDIYLNNTSSRS
jgi:hypothetical protein